ncbi:MAG: hypothetical protein GY757_33300 [bacterium]|nr:hypothetical protein [bacterium]
MITKKDSLKKILVVNNAEKGITEFYDPFVKILAEAGTPCQIAEYSDIPDLNSTDISGIILTGSPCGDDIVVHHRPWFQWLKSCTTPVLGICAGHHIIGDIYGSKLLRSVEIEIGDFDVFPDAPEDPIFNGLALPFKARQNHKDSITLPNDFLLLAHSANCNVSAMKHPTKPIYSTQFHPEFLNIDMILNFVAIAEKDKSVSDGPSGG